MEDREIVALYFARNEAALAESKRKYGRMLLNLAISLLQSREDSEECENDTYLSAWNKIPPERPVYLGAYLAKITRFLSMNILRKRSAEKRPETVGTALEELEECIPDSDGVEKALESRELKAAINAFLRVLSADDRYIFVRRYFYSEEVKAIAKRLSCSEGRVKTRLFRMRSLLQKRLEKEGWRWQ